MRIFRIFEEIFDENFFLITLLTFSKQTPDKTLLLTLFSVPFLEMYRDNVIINWLVFFLSHVRKRR